jgi:uncharacterized protein YbjT (DUF2867 family)
MAAYEPVDRELKRHKRWPHVALPWGPATTAIPMVSAEDVARVAVGILMGPAMPNGTVMPLIGEVVTNQGIGDAVSDLLGRPVPYVELSDEQWLEGARRAGINAVAIEHLVHLWRYLRTGGAGSQDTARAARSIERLGGTTPLSLRKFLSKQREAFAGVVGQTE